MARRSGFVACETRGFLEGAAPGARCRRCGPFNRRRRSGALHDSPALGRMVILMLFDRVDACPFEMESVRRASARGAHGRGRAGVERRRGGLGLPHRRLHLPLRDLRPDLPALRRAADRRRSTRRCRIRCCSAICPAPSNACSAPCRKGSTEAVRLRGDERQLAGGRGARGRRRPAVRARRARQGGAALERQARRVVRQLPRRARAGRGQRRRF